jgi:TPR repeat protein
LGIAQDFAGAAHYYRLSADQGNPRGRWRLGELS